MRTSAPAAAFTACGLCPRQGLRLDATKGRERIFRLDCPRDMIAHDCPAVFRGVTATGCACRSQHAKQLEAGAVDSFVV
ncbi:hypothetical protein LL06_13245 [Hoeflea sp. BAL378]|nr:hypothetical protein LL06_13245 [Hoeflea sp. BAL378]